MTDSAKVLNQETDEKPSKDVREFRRKLPIVEAERKHGRHHDGGEENHLRYEGDKSGGCINIGFRRHAQINAQGDGQSECQTL